MPALAVIYEPIADELNRVCRIFDDELFSELLVVNELCSHVRQYRGKMLRPALLLLSARACGNTREEHLTLAAVVEMVHMATLVHDDILDEADVRRRVPTINRLQGNEAAVLLGDYLISHAFHLCASLSDTFACRRIGAATNVVCEGELQQVHHRGDLELAIEHYLDIITRKTATLTSVACQLGAHYADAPDNVVASLERYGLQVGIAFQITDDVLDITGSPERMGKTLGRDLDENKLTLPLIHALHTAPPALREGVHRQLGKNHPDREVINGLLRESGSVDYALAMATRYVESAVACLGELGETDASAALAQLARMIVRRDV